MGNNLPVSPSITSFDLDIWTKCDFDALGLILRCMPNIRRFILGMMISSYISPFWMDSLNGQYWQQLLTNYVPHIDIFELLLNVIIDPYSQLDMDAVILSFDYFSTKYNDWCIIMNQSKLHGDSHSKIIIMINSYLYVPFSKNS